MSVYIKIYEAYRRIVAVCDSDLIGKKIEEGNFQLDINEKFYKGDLFEDKDEIMEILKEEQSEDSCFNFVGEESCNLGIKTGIIEENSVIEIQGVKHALSLL